jgi:2-amino-4-hydroxy-6-hydroxymethyldihydropteridine diphosphokinase
MERTDKQTPFPHRACIALGANLGERAKTLSRAITVLRDRTDVRVVDVSSFIETEPVGGPAGQPCYLNGAAMLETSLAPCEVLKVLLNIEHELGRDRSSPERNQPRVIDLDVLLFDDKIVDEAELKIPHPRMHERLFVLQPLAEIASGWLHPILNKRVDTLLAELVKISPVA